MIEQSMNNQWEHALLALAQEAGDFYSNVQWPTLTSPASHQLRKAYARCEEITSQHSRSFYMATSLLPGEQRRAIRALYALCRVADDYVDEGFAQPEFELQRLREHIHHANSTAVENEMLADVLLAWEDTRSRFNVPLRFVDQLLDGVERDLRQTRYSTFEELTVYCYGVASTVGLMSLHILGFSPEATPYALKMGVALQLTNILRDFGEDMQVGRLYLPQEDLAAFELCDEDLAAGQVDERWQAMMQFQIERTRRIYTEAWPGLVHIHPTGRRAVTAAATFYRAILDDIEAHHYDVFSRRAHVSRGGKIRLLLRMYTQDK